jgi:hypothetical protein
MEAVTDDPLYIIAGTYLEATYYARRYGLGQKEWHWVKGAEDFYGLTGGQVLFAGNFSKRKDIRLLGDAVKTRGMTWRYEPEQPFEMPTN